MSISRENSLKISVLCDRIIKWGFYFLAFITPLFFMPFNTNVLETNKQLILVVFALLMAISWLGKIIIDGRLILRKSLLNLGIVAFLIFYLISAFVSKNAYNGFVGSGSVITESFFSIFSLVLLFFVLINNFYEKKEVLNIIFVLIASGLIAGIFGLLQLSGKFILPWDFAKNISFNSIGSVNSLEIFLASLLVLSSVLFAETETVGWRRFFYGLAAGFFLFMMLAINYRNVWWGLAIATVIIVALGMLNRRQVSQYRLILPMVILAFSVLMILPVRMNLFSQWLQVPIEVSPSFNATLEIDKQVAKDNLFFGTGPGSFSYGYGLYRSLSLNNTDFWSVRFSQGFSKAFSLPVTIGLFGWLSWLVIIIGFAFYGFWTLIARQGKNWPLALGFFSAWFMLAWLQFFYSTNLTLEFAFWVMLALSFLALKSLVPKGKEETTEDLGGDELVKAEFDRTSPLASILSFILVIVLVMAISGLYLGGTYYYADIVYQKGLKAVNNNDLEKGSSLISRAVTLNPYNDLYLRDLSQIALLKVNQELAKPQDANRDRNVQNLIATAINIAKRATDLAPLNVDNWVQRASIYRAVMAYIPGADQWAIDSYQEATRLEPNNPLYAFELGRSYFLAADFLTTSASKDKEKQAKREEYLAKAEELFKKSVQLKSDYAVARFNLASLYDYENKLDEAVKEMTQVKDAYPQDMGVAFQLGLIYYKQAKWDLAKQEFERAILLDENYANARYFLSLVYDKLGNKTAAIEHMEKVAKLNPDNQDVKTALENLRAGKPAVPEAPQQPSNVPIEQ